MNKYAIVTLGEMLAAHRRVPMSPSRIRLIHAACRELGLDDDARRGLQLLATGKSSLTEMTTAEMEAVVFALKARGWNPGVKGRKANPLAPRGDLRLIHVLWRRLGDAKAINQPGRVGLNAFIRTRFGEAWGAVPADIDMMRDAAQIATVLEALKAIARRNGVKF